MVDHVEWVIKLKAKKIATGYRPIAIECCRNHLIN